MARACIIHVYRRAGLGVSSQLADDFLAPLGHDECRLTSDDVDHFASRGQK